MNTICTLSALLLTLISLSTADDLDGFVPGFRIDQIFIPSDCTHRAREGDFVYQHYTGYLSDGTKFDSSHDRDGTYNFNLGVGEVIKGMDMGMKGMCKGEKRKITIPPELGYGGRDLGKIPPYSTLVFDVELADIDPSGFKIELIYLPDNCTRRSAAGDYIREHYNGTFPDGTAFDSSYDRDRTYDFTLGERQVIKGVDMGLMNMCEGEKRRLTVPSILAYGEDGYDDLIPPHATLVFDVELVEIVEGKLKWYKIDGPSCSEQEAVHHNDEITIMYNGFTESRFKFTNGYVRNRTADTNTTSEDPYKFRVGDEDILHGLTHGVSGMCNGERRRLRIPPELAYRDVNGAGVPQGIRLTLDIEIIDIHKEDLFKAIDTNQDRYISMQEVEEWIKTNPEYEERIAENADELEKLKSYYFTDRDEDKNDWVSRNEFYFILNHHDEL